jgi:hypothetical protein
LFAEPIRKLLIEDDAPVDLWYIVVPDEIYLLGRPNSKVPVGERIVSNRKMNVSLARKLSREPSLFADDMAATEPYKFDLDFHNQLKIRLIGTSAITQIVRESTLTPIENGVNSRRRLQDAATVAWNLSTSSFFKAGGRPWRLADVRPGVCYVGLVFKRMLHSEGNACCGAQMFLDSGDGMVLKGAVGSWYSEETREFHLSKEVAKEIMEKIVNAYFSVNSAYPQEIFIHGQVRFNDDEWSGFREGSPSDSKIVGIQIRRSSDIKLFRPGKLPPLRGTAFRYQDRRAALWTTGLIPKLGTYPGREVPNPLHIEVCRGAADMDVVLEDILRLTKLNFNACIYSDGLPVTLRFANVIGDILTAGPAVPDRPLPFRHYI